MSIGAYGISVLASLMLIASAAGPVAHKFFTQDRGRGEAMTQKLFIGGLSFSTSAERLREFLARVEGVESATVVTDRATGQSRGFGFVEMASVEAAKTAMQALNGQELDGRQLRIELANPSGERRGDFRGGAPGGRRW
jgi:RNA recognition motif-containing protein